MAAFLACSFPLPVLAATTAESPDGRIVFTLSTGDSGRPAYTVTYDGKPAVLESRLGMRFRAHPGFDGGLTIGLPG